MGYKIIIVYLHQYIEYEMQDNYIIFTPIYRI
jgi:hypothetical protein